ncbi:YciI family protein [Streptomyces sp. MBT33]|uniref:YciI family protein n=1 Tax=unclassified Streptomyces TaxID=2593676 RepID=UPI00190A347E|nr:YciI family protein [Streptomyces sp. MBT33]MBK3639118.1 transcription initiation protein [Streptomyces sp. MBT33]
MRYALLVRRPAGGEERAAESAHRPPDARAGRVADAVRLRPAVDATTVRVQGGEVLLGDGPFAHSEEDLAAIALIDVDDLDEAIAVAAGHPYARDGGSVEVRPVWE